VAGPRIATSFSPLVALRIAKPISFGVEQSVQRLLNRAANNPVQVPPDRSSSIVITFDSGTASHGGFVPLFRLT
jgi:hypothetical protein